MQQTRWPTHKGNFVNEMIYAIRRNNKIAQTVKAGTESESRGDKLENNNKNENIKVHEKLHTC